MTKYLDISLDLETWGKRAGFDIRSLGACVFDLDKNIVFDSIDSSTCLYFATENPSIRKVLLYKESQCVVATYDDIVNILTVKEFEHWDGIDSIRKYPLKRDPETVDWWKTQSEEAQSAFENPLDLKDGLMLFRDWLYNLADLYPNTDIRLWSHGAAFDISILEAVYHAVKLPVPWHYRAARDTRTIFDRAKIRDHSAWMKQHNKGELHHALYDAISQAHAISAAYNLP